MLAFDYKAPENLDEALALKSRLGPDAHILAGGTNLVAKMRTGLVPSGLLLDLNRIAGQDDLSTKDGRVRIGPLLRVESLLSTRHISPPLSLLKETARIFANPLIRNRATVAGNLADASPAADLAVPLLALGAELTLTNASEERKLPLNAFFLGPNMTALREDELITEISVPLPEGAPRTFYRKLGLRKADAISIVSIAVLLETKEGRCQRVRVALGAVAPVPLRAEKAEAFLAGKELSSEVITEFSALVAAQTSPIDDIRASADYRRRMVEVLTGRGLNELKGTGDESDPD